MDYAERLYKEYKKHNSLIVAFDFDNTIYDYSHNGDDYSHIVNLLKKCKQLGCVLILYTVETNPDKLKWKNDYCKENLGFYPDYINYSPVFSETAKQGKIYYNVLLDDRAGLAEAYNTLKIVIERIEHESN